jgi:hypothetical protein
MRSRLPAVAVLVAALIVPGLGAHAQEDRSFVTFDGIGFSFDRSLGSSVNVTRVPGQPLDVEQPGGPDVPHLAFTLYGTRAEAAQVPRVALGRGVVRAYRTADLDGYEEASEQLEALRTLLADRPDVADLMAVADEFGPRPLPRLPVPAAAQAVLARVAYVDTPVVSGVAYLTAYRQDVSPFAASDFWYGLQGLSADGQWHVNVEFVVTAPGFPERVTARQANREAERWMQYLEESVAALNGTDADAFQPPLTSIDALVASIAIEGVGEPEPSPGPAG